MIDHCDDMECDGRCAWSGVDTERCTQPWLDEDDPDIEWHDAWCAALDELDAAP